VLKFKRKFQRQRVKNERVYRIITGITQHKIFKTRVDKNIRWKDHVQKVYQNEAPPATWLEECIHVEKQAL
jgi:hypothetical protein